MSEDVDTDAEDTISVPIPTGEPEEEPETEVEVEPEAVIKAEEREKFERTVAELAGMRDLLQTLERTLDVARIAFENLKTAILGDGESVVHAWPMPGVELTPCCGKKMMDVPLTERIAIDPSEITCGKVPV